MTRKLIMTACSLLAIAVSCVKESRGPAEDPVSETVISLESSGFTTRSSLGGTAVEEKAGTVLAVAYDETGALESSILSSGLGDIPLPLRADKGHNIYVLVNMALDGIPVDEEAMRSLTWTIPSWSALAASGLPMAGSLTLAPGAKSGTVFLDRLVSKITLNVDTGDFYDCLERLSGTALTRNFNVRLHNLNSVLRPFGESVASTVADLLPDGCEQEIDFDASAGAVLYVPENMQGKLLDNDDPMDRDEGHLGSAAAVCSYLDVSFGQDVSVWGVGGNLVYRFYLGDNVLDNFDVRRNTNYNVTLKTQWSTVDDCFSIDSWHWKVSSDDWSDTREITFDKSAYTVQTGGSVAVGVLYNYDGGRKTGLCGTANDWALYIKNPSDGQYRAYDEQISGLPALSYNPATDSFNLTASASSGTVMDLLARTRDGRHSATARLVVTSARSLVPVWDSEPSYIAQKGVLTAGNLDDGASLSLFTVTSGSECVRWTRSGSEITLSAIMTGTVTYTMSSTSGQTTEGSLSIAAPSLTLTSPSIALDVDGTEKFLTVGFTGSGGQVMTRSATRGAAYFDPELYDELLAPYVTIPGSGAGLFMATSAETAAGARRAAVWVKDMTEGGEKIEDHLSAPVSATVRVVSEAVRTAVADKALTLSLRRPFSSPLGPGNLLSTLDNTLLIYNTGDHFGKAVKTKSSSSSIAFGLDRKAAFNLSPSGFNLGFSCLSLECEAEDFSLSLSSSGIVTLEGRTEKDLTYSYGDKAVYAQVWNNKSGRYGCRTEIGVIRTYLFSALGGIFHLDRQFQGGNYGSIAVWTEIIGKDYDLTIKQFAQNIKDIECIRKNPSDLYYADDESSASGYDIYYDASTIEEHGLYLDPEDKSVRSRLTRYSFNKGDTKPGSQLYSLAVGKVDYDMGYTESAEKVYDRFYGTGVVRGELMWQKIIESGYLVSSGGLRHIAGSQWHVIIPDTFFISYTIL